MKTYNATAILDERFGPDSETRTDAILDALIEFHPAVNRGSDGRMEIVVTIPAETLTQAEQTALALTRDFHPIGLEVVPTDVWDARAAHIVEMPELVSVAEAAELLGVTRQTVAQRISAGSLPAQRVGGTWVLARATVAA